MASFVCLRVRFPRLSRPYHSPLGVPGAALAGAIAAVTLAILFLNRDYNPGVMGAAVWLLAGIAYFALRGRHRLVLSPEEQFAEEARSSEWAPTATR